VDATDFSFAFIIPGLRIGYPYFAPPGLLIIASTRVFYVKVKSKHRNIVDA
jgi:hypothetical protein